MTVGRTVLLVGAVVFGVGCEGPRDYGYGFNNPERQPFGKDGRRVPPGELSWTARAAERAPAERWAAREYEALAAGR